MKKYIDFLNENKTSLFYHITPTINIPKILKEGIEKPVYLTDSIEKCILWRDIKTDEMIELGEEIIKGWSVIKIKNINKDELSHKNYYGDDFMDFPTKDEFNENIFVVDEYVYSHKISPDNIVEIIKVKDMDISNYEMF